MFTRGFTATAGGGAPARRGASAALLLAAALAVTGCGAAGDGDGGAGARADRGAAAPEAAHQEAGRQAGREAGAYEQGASQADRGSADGERAADDAPDLAATHVIRTASLTVTAEDVPEKLARARTVVETAGGYVAEEDTDSDSQGHDRSRMTLRVPPEEYQGVLEELAGLGEQVERKVSAKDVTDQVVDVESRIRTQKASVERVRKLMDEAAALSDVVTLEAELSSRQADLEALQSRLKSLESRTGMATVTLVLREPDAEPAEPEEDDAPSFLDALSGGWHAFVSTVRWITVVLGVLLPFAAAALLVALVWRLVRPWLPCRPKGVLSRRTGPAVPTPPVTVPGPVAGSVAGPGAASGAAPDADAVRDDGGRAKGPGAVPEEPKGPEAPEKG
ncbi:DUF4349 domain-containing protein [Streptomyces verrucosisporus]|uniref:DUF4349 domain-containing protein n=1 Tax=Streptomyces verrucosisporus TaxID=1695161 RepID=UPI0019D311FF|nr:DUF4349 domain-containing protein [Streptomyces verrucosisporus]MBN3931765.1 DUF4349 domain-containing protein [Streptomyces verrucosisporus]